MPVSSKKRAAPSGDGATRSTAQPPTAKKRKTDPNAQKYYAVRAGFKPGVYLTWTECQNQTTGFRGAQFKSFLSRQDAESFVAGLNPPSASGEPKPEKFYAVARGIFTGIFTDWETASHAIKGMKGPKYRKFDTRADAVEYIKEWGSAETIAMVQGGSDGKAPMTTKQALQLIEDDEDEDDDDDDDEDDDDDPDPTMLHIYTDGSSLSNGKLGAAAGVGVFFGKNDPRNVSERLEGELQTNQRAELTAILRALQKTPVIQGVQIFTDSQYSINCVTQWYKGWERNNWVTSQKEEVKNKDLVKAIRDRMNERDRLGTRTVYTWVKGHSTNVGNIAADQLAVQGAKGAASSAAKATRGKKK